MVQIIKVVFLTKPTTRILLRRKETFKRNMVQCILKANLLKHAFNIGLDQRQLQFRTSQDRCEWDRNLPIQALEQLQICFMVVNMQYLI